jgi:2-methylcitrate dehydratase PrpD
MSAAIEALAHFVASTPWEAIPRAVREHAKLVVLDTIGVAPELALAGVGAKPDAIEEAFAGLVGDGFRPETVTEDLGQRWEITRNYFRLRACGNPNYAALDALEDILAEHKPAPDRIASVDVATYRFAADMREPEPLNSFAAKYSLPHAAAALILRGNAGYHASTEETARDPRIAAFRRKVTVREDPALNASVPRLKPARVTVTFTDGRQVTRLRETAAGISRIRIEKTRSGRSSASSRAWCSAPAPSRAWRRSSIASTSVRRALRGLGTADTPLRRGSRGLQITAVGTFTRRCAMPDPSQLHSDRSYPGRWTITSSNPPTSMTSASARLIRRLCAEKALQ